MRERTLSGLWDFVKLTEGAIACPSAYISLRKHNAINSCERSSLSKGRRLLPNR